MSGKILIVAEKPSVARDIARVLGVTGRGRGALTSERCVVTWCIGHLVGLAEPGVYDARWGEWRLDALPMIPTSWQLQASAHTEEQFDNVSRLLTSQEFSCVVNACDAGREGELIFRYVYALAGSSLPIKRLWIASLTEEAIQEGMRRLLPGSELENLYHAARCRSEADWLVGLNATRVVTLAARQRYPHARLGLLSVGRVQTPTLALVVHRDQAIEGFTSRPFWEIQGTFSSGGGETYTGKMQLAAQEVEHPTRLDTLEARDAALAQVQGHRQGQVVVLEQKEGARKSPQFFDLTSLQRIANQRLGFTAQHTLDVAQALYEKHKVLSYPRTDSKYITPDLARTLPRRIAAVAAFSPLGALARALSPDVAALSARLVNAERVTDHHAILPTEQPPRRALDEDEAALYELVCRRTLAALAPPAKTMTTRVQTRVNRALFETRGVQVVEPGWMQFEKDDEEREEGEAKIPSSLSLGEVVRVEGMEGRDGKTKPPARYTEASLLSAMERAGSGLGDEELSRALSGGGLGTPATRASTIETLVGRAFVERKGKSLTATPRGIALIQALSSFPTLTSAEMTARWERGLGMVEAGTLAPERFMESTVEMARQLVAFFVAHPPELPIETPESVGRCPSCGAPVQLTEKVAFCSRRRRDDEDSCSFVLFRTVAKKKLTSKQLQRLLTAGITNELNGFTSSKGNKFAAKLRLEQGEDGMFKLTFVFSDTTRGKKRGGGKRTRSSA